VPVLLSAGLVLDSHVTHLDNRMDLEPVVAYLIPKARVWISEQRELHRPEADSLDAPVLAAMAPFYSLETLKRARFRVVERIENPPFYIELASLMPGIPLIEFSDMEAITFDDTILLSKSRLRSDVLSVVFHELVHLSQYVRLGIPDFASRYVRGWAENNMDYWAIPLERDAYGLQERFDRRDSFSVEAAVAQQLSTRSSAT
jgi:hypothetical protein